MVSNSVHAGDKHAYVETQFPVLDDDDTQPLASESLDSIAKSFSEGDLLKDDLPEPPVVGF